MRIRSIKPEFWSSDDIAALSWENRLLFIGLWSYVADSGVGRDNPKLIAADLFPLEDDPLETLATVSRGLASLSEAGLITRYRVGTKRFLHITEWAAHQKIDKPTRSNFPPPTCEDAIFDEPSRETLESSPPGSRDLGNEGSRERGSEGPSSDTSDQTRPTRFEEFWDTYGKKVGKKEAKAKYLRALKKPGVTEDLLIAAAASYVLWERQNNQGGRFIKDASRWLHGEHWGDERPLTRLAPAGRTEGWLTLVEQLRAEEHPMPQIEGGSR
jgi:hypothetical protein